MNNIAVGAERMDLISKLIDQLNRSGIDTGHAMRFSKAGEWGLSFQELYFAARSNQKVYSDLRLTLDQLDEFFEQDQYLVKHCGFPLRFSSNNDGP